MARKLRTRTAPGPKGWYRQEFTPFLAAMKQQQQPGPLVEIGVHEGASFQALYATRSVGMPALAVDIFAEGMGYSGTDRRRTFENHMKLAFPGQGALADLKILEADTNELDQSDYFQQLGELRPRIIHVDGDHTPAGAYHDLEVAASIVRRQDGVIIVDDVYNYGWPGVSEALHRLLQSDTYGSAADLGLRPILIAHGKVCLSFQHDWKWPGEPKKVMETYGQQVPIYHP